MKIKNVINKTRVAITLIGSLALSNYLFAQAPISQLAPGDEYVALGSSFASGPGIAEILDQGCARSSENYAQLVAREFNLALQDVSCSGATIANVVTTPQRNQSGETVATQIDVLSDKTKLVTVTVGGNSFDYSLRTIQAACDATGIFSRAVKKSVLCFMVGQMDTSGNAEALKTIDSQLSTMLEAIKAKAPNAKIVFVDYTTVFAKSAEQCTANQPIDSVEVDKFIEQAEQFAQAIETVTNTMGIELIKMSEASQNHHVCAKEPWVSGFEYGSNGIIPYHPNRKAMVKAAELIIDALKP